jgi:Terpene cyclase DEP1
MKPKTIYLALSLVGALLPYWQFVPWVVEHGMNLSLFVQNLFVNRISAFFGLDVLVSAVVLVVFMRIESTRLNIHRRWLPVLAVLLVGVSLALPLFLYLREARLEQLKPLENTPTSA